MKIRVSDTKDYFVCEGKPFFYLADTVWSAFTNTTLEEWEEYLVYRKAQDFNTLQINILPQWDKSQSDTDTIPPFILKDDGEYDFFKPNEAYFKKAQTMLGMAVEKGFVPALVVLWCNYVPDTWASQLLKKNIMPFEAVRPYCEYIVNAFSKYDPIYMICGDTDFQNEYAYGYYLEALNVIKEISPESVTTMHLGGNRSDLPEKFIQSPKLDFYMYQSGHGGDVQNDVYKLSEDFLKMSVKRPIVNGEPCYEGHGNCYGRFKEYDIRKATWQSLLTGSKAGVTYGAHGVWSWHKPGKHFPGEGFSGTPYDWRTALRFEGAWDVSFAKWIFEEYDLFNIVPLDIVVNKPQEARVSASPDGRKLVIYTYNPHDLEVKADLNGYNWTLISLDKRFFAKPEILKGNETSIIRIPQFNSDVLLIGIK